MSHYIGRVLSHRYRMEEYLGEGGMASVYKVWDAERATYLALKLLREDLAQDHVFIRRFRREAHTLESLQHPNIVRFYGFEQDDLLAFLLMDLVDGESLRAEIFRRQGNPIPEDRILEVFRAVSSALHFAHRRGVAHCDVKPANILVAESGRVLLSDFGVARTTENATAMTMMSPGTPAYMAPEQFYGVDPTPSTDIYALGILLFEMLSGGERPFTGENTDTSGSTLDKVRWEHLHQTPPSIRRFNPSVSLEVDQIIAGCLYKQPEERYSSVAELLQELEKAVNAPRGTSIEVERILTDAHSGTNPQHKLENVASGIYDTRSGETIFEGPVPLGQREGITLGSGHRWGLLSRRAPYSEAVVQPSGVQRSRRPRKSWAYTVLAASMLGINWMLSLVGKS